MGILNVTPDSFSDGGQFRAHDEALRRAEQMLAEGADWIDIGGESTRPGAAAVELDEELRRVLPLLERLSGRLDVPISIDTRKAEVARQAIDAGATLVNDVSALGDPEMAGIVAQAGVPIVLMHMRGKPETMQNETGYEEIVGEVLAFLRERIQIAEAAGIRGDKIIIDPGIGFGKSTNGNCTLLRQLPRLAELGKPILVGASRKNFIGDILSGAPVEERLEGSLVVAVLAAMQGAQIVRVHDVAPTVRAIRVVNAIRMGRQTT